MSNRMAGHAGRTVGFRTTYEISLFGFHPDRAAVELSTATPITAKIFLSHNTQVRDGETRQVRRATVTSQRAVNGTALRSFELLAKGRVDRGLSEFLQQDWAREVVQLDGTIVAGREVPLDLLPGEFQALARSVDEDHLAAAQRAIALLRWAYGTPGRPNPLAIYAREWNLDGRWRKLPYDRTKPSRGYAHRSPFSEDWEINAMQTLIDSAVSEPLGRSLWLEASTLRNTSPRSALIAAVVAIELALKVALREHGFPKKNKDRDWKLSQLLRQPLRMLALKATVPFGVPVLPQASMVSAISDLVKKRNDLVHTGTFALTSAEVDAVIDAAEDFVWLMDFYRGYPWALQRLRPDTLSGIAKSAGLETRAALLEAVLSAKRV